MIEIKELCYQYPGNRDNTLHGLNFEVHKGEILGFLGPSGAGKSTTQKILTRLNRGYEGSVKVNNKELSTLGREYYEEIGVSFELPNLYTRFTARENLEFFASLYSTSVHPQELLELVGLGEHSERRVSDFSKGMKMRLNFIRAFLNDPSLVFLDEPTSGLDPVNARLIKDFILGLKDKGKTVFLTTHNMQVAQDICDRVAFIVDGEIKLLDTPDNLMVEYGKNEVIAENALGEEREFPMEGLGHNSSFLEFIQKNPLRRIHSKDATLEDIFIEVTGRSLS